MSSNSTEPAQPKKVTDNDQFWLSWGLFAAGLFISCYFVRRLWVDARYYPVAPENAMVPQGLYLEEICLGFALATPFLASVIWFLLPGSFLIRTIAATFWTSITYYLFFLGSLYEDQRIVGPLFEAELRYSLPFLVILFSVPAGMLHWFGGWKISFSRFDQVPEKPRLTILSLLCFTFAIGSALAVANRMGNPEKTMQWMIAGGVVCLFFGVLTCLGGYTIFRSPRPWLPFACSSLGTPLLIGMIFFLGTTIFSLRGPVRTEQVISAGIVTTSFALAFSGSLFMLRMQGAELNHFSKKPTADEVH